MNAHPLLPTIGLAAATVVSSSILTVPAQAAVTARPVVSISFTTPAVTAASSAGHVWT